MSDSTKALRARALFESGYNCAQSVFAAFAPEMGMDEKEALRLSSSFGGGMGGLREVCGAVSGMFMAMGALHGYDTPDDLDRKKAHYASLQALAERFRAENGTLLCRELLEKHGLTPSSVPAGRDAAYYAKRPCAKYVEQCAAMVEETLKNN